MNELPRNWREAAAPPELARIGDEFAEKQEHCVLLIPSVIVPHEHNWLINPDHPDARWLVAEELEPMSYDRRMFR